MAIDFSHKKAGMLVPVFALRRTGDFGIGDTRSVLQAIDFCASQGMGVLQLLPINETGGDNSPYNAISSVALDPVMVTLEPEEVPGLTLDILARLASEDRVAPLRKGPVNYREVKSLKHGVMREAYNCFQKNAAHALKNAFEDFLRDESEWIKDYSLFRALVDEHGGNACWTQWAEHWQSPKLARMHLKKSSRREKVEDSADYYSFVQWVCLRQWMEVRHYADQKGVQLMGDIPFGVSRYGADVWAKRELFDLEWSGGAPPESFFKGDPFTEQWGQNWGIPLYRWEAHEQSRFRWWKQRVQATTRIFQLFRIDHVLGFFRIYAFPWIPERNAEFVGLTPEQARQKTGGDLPQFKPGSDDTKATAEVNRRQGEHLLKKILQFSGEAGVVAEDLGVVPPYVRPVLEELGIPGFTIPIFERDEKTYEFRDPATYPHINLVTCATHDHLPLAAYYDDLVKKWHAPDGHPHWLEVQRLMRLVGLDDRTPPTQWTSELHRAFLVLLMKSPGWLSVSMITDILGTRQRFNMPGVSADSNWSERLEYPLDHYQAHSETAGKISMYSDLIRASQRWL